MSRDGVRRLRTVPLVDRLWGAYPEHNGVVSAVKVNKCGTYTGVQREDAVETGTLVSGSASPQGTSA